MRNNKVLKLLWTILAVYLLNISADTADPRPYYLPEDLSINDQESMAEVLVEMVLGFEKAFPEYDDPDTDDEGMSFDMGAYVLHAFCTPSFNPIFRLIRKTFFSLNMHLPQGHGHLEGPPPKA